MPDDPPRADDSATIEASKPMAPTIISTTPEPVKANETSAQDHGTTCRVTFELPAAVDVSSAALCGDFND